MTSPRSDRPVDQAARDRIRSALDETLFVEAGAGTGKTRQLVDRVVELVVLGRSELGSVAAITFTEAAASELRHRLTAALQDAAADEGHPPAARERCRRAVADVDHAAISTLHAFAQRLLREHPVEAGLPPSVEVVDEIESSLAFDRRWRSFLDRLFDRADLEPTLLRALVVDVTPERLRHLCEVFNDNYDLLEEVAWPEISAPQLDHSTLAGHLRDALALRGGGADETDTMVRRLGELDDHLRRLDGAESSLDLLELLQSGPAIRGDRVGNRRKWHGDLEEVRAHLARAEDARDRLVAAVGHHCLQRLARELAAFTLESAEQRRRQGRLEYHDLLVLARRLLRNRPDVRAVLHERYTSLLIDEFQDTDPIQIELAVLIASDDPTAGGRPWAAVPVESGRLFFVGDAKQSIYRFRRAHIELFLSARDAFAGEPTELVQSFRSVPGVLEFVNGVFAQLIEYEPDAQPAYSRLRAHRPPTVGPNPPVVVLGGPHAEGNAQQLREAEAADVAAVIVEALTTPWQVVDETASDPTRTRDARPSDITILLPARTSLHALEDALEDAAVAYRAETGSLVWNTQEVRELLAILQAVDDPGDDIAVVAALRSPGFACGDDDLYEWHRAGGGWDPSEPAPSDLPTGHPVSRAFAVLRGLHERRQWEPVSVIVDTVLHDCRLFELALAERRPRDTWRRLRYVLDQARAFGETSGGTLRDFLVWASRQASDLGRVVEPVLPEPDDEAVRIMTIHGAKGLEFPITILSGMTSRPRASGRGVRVLWTGPGQPPEIRLPGDLKTDAFDAHQPLDEQMDRYERLRLLYVAATRARDHLVVSGHHRPTRSRSSLVGPGQLLWEAAQSARRLWRPGPDPAAVRPPLPAREQAFEAPETTEVDRRRWIAERHEAFRLRGAAPVLAATAIARAGSPGDPGLEKDGVDLDRPPWRRGRAGTAVGRAVHATLQTVDLAGGQRVAATARAQAAAEGVADRAAEIEHLTRAALAAPVVREAATVPHWRELYVAAPVGGVLVEGFVDLLLRTPRGLVVVDYKTDSVVGEAGLEAAVSRYRLQAAAYALALETHLDEAVTDCVFVFLGAGGAQERRVLDLPACIEEVRRIVAGSLPAGPGPGEG